jgi:protein tyrosine phosphatase (PTP) superfamily phosphohydrolase (DUF442 family)
VPALHDRHAMLALATRLGRRAAGAIRADTVHPLGDDPRGGGFAGATDARHDEGLRDPVGGKGILERADHRILPDQIGKCLRPILSGENLIWFGGGFGHSALRPVLQSTVMGGRAEVHREGASMAEFVVNEIEAGGGWLAITPLPGRGGLFQADFARLVAWDPSLVISMTPTQEMESRGAASLGRDLAAMGIAWEHLPVIDFGAPGGDVEEAWPALSLVVRSILVGGGRVLVHCHGGCGRSGMIVLRLMVELGEAPEAALARLRGVRPCAVETEAQFAWASGPPIPTSRGV